MSAKEMFEKLGFENTMINDCLVVYERYIECRNNFYSECVQFHLNDKTFEMNNLDEITMSILKAINKQVEELGWSK